MIKRASKKPTDIILMTVLRIPDSATENINRQRTRETMRSLLMEKKVMVCVFIASIVLLTLSDYTFNFLN